MANAGMGVAGKSLRVAAATLAVGLSLAGPQAVGVAAAESGDGDTASAATDDHGGSADRGGAGRAPSQPGNRRGSRLVGNPAASTKPASRAPADKLGIVADPTSTAAPKPQRNDLVAAEVVGTPVRDVAAVEPVRVVEGSAQTRRGAAAAMSGRSAPTVANAPDAGQSVTDEPVAVALSLPIGSVTQMLPPLPSASSDPAAGAARSCRECRNSAATGAVRPGAAAIAQTLTGLSLAIERLLDAVGTVLSDLPFLAGALLLVRRGLFNQTPTVSPQVLVGDVLRPMSPEEGSVFSTSLTGEVVGTLGAVDPEGAVLSYELRRAPQFGAVRIDPGGTWTYTPSDASAALEDVFTVSVIDRGWNILDPFASPAEMVIRVRPGLTSSALGRGLISSDWLEVVKETGELNGDEPVIVSVVMTTTLGVGGSTSVRIVNKFPRQIASGVDPGGKVPIPDSDGDVWIDYSTNFQPLTWAAFEETTTKNMSVYRVDVTEGGLGYDLLNPPEVRFEGGLEVGGVAATARAILKPHPNPDPDDDFGYIVTGIEITDPGRGYISAPTVVIDVENGGEAAAATAVVGAPVPLPLIVVATLMLEGDFTPTGIAGDLGTPVGEKLKLVGEELEKTKIYVEDIANQKFGATTSAVDTIKEKVQLTGTDVAKIAANRIAEWFLVRDPDDPVAVGVTGMIPVEGTFIDNFAELRDLTFGDNVKLDDQFMYSKTVDLDPIKVLGIQLWDFDLATRFGFLVPLSKNDRKDGKPQGWETTYSGDYTGNDPAQWKVETQSWLQANW